MKISGHIAQHIKSENRSLDTKTPRMLSKLSTMDREFTAICINPVALKMMRMSSSVTSTLKNSLSGISIFWMSVIL